MYIDVCIAVLVECASMLFVVDILFEFTALMIRIVWLFVDNS